MNIANSLFNSRKQTGLSQEDVAQKIGVSRQTISKWELGETLPDIYQAKRLASIYKTTLDELITFDVSTKEVENMITEFDNKKTSNVDWTKVWSKKYPILSTYQHTVSVTEYEEKLLVLLKQLKSDYNFNTQDSMLVLKDIMSKVWQKA